MPVKLLEEIENEIVTILSNLIKINTTNPPGNELKAALYIKNILLNKEYFFLPVFLEKGKRYKSFLR